MNLKEYIQNKVKNLLERKIPSFIYLKTLGLNHYLTYNVVPDKHVYKSNDNFTIVLNNFNEKSILQQYLRDKYDYIEYTCHIGGKDNKHYCTIYDAGEIFSIRDEKYSYELWNT